MKPNILMVVRFYQMVTYLCQFQMHYQNKVHYNLECPFNIILNIKINKIQNLLNKINLLS